jgi:hypothetical protein
VVGGLLIFSLAVPQAWAKKKGPVQVIQAQTEIPEESLLDVGIQVFDPGLPEEVEQLMKLEEEGVFAEVRKSEARYIPIHLKRTIESTGFWGAVRLVPAANSVDVMVTGTILKSTGKDLEVEVMVVDSLGKRWMREKYEQEADVASYSGGDVGILEPYQSLYNQIANDLLKQRQKRKDDYIRKVRTVSELKFAVDLAPTAFADYVQVDKKGRYSIEKLPARDDPMMERLARIRERDLMFIDTLNEYYADFYARMDEPYDSWRAFSYEEQVAYEKLKRAATLEKILGAAAIIGGIYSSTRGRSGRAAGEVAIIGGMAAIQDAMQKSEESKMHRQALTELGASLDSEVTPLLLDVEGEVMRLTGSVETQYATWRQLLREIFASETGLPVDPNSGAVEAVKNPTSH